MAKKNLAGKDPADKAEDKLDQAEQKQEQAQERAEEKADKAEDKEPEPKSGKSLAMKKPLKGHAMVKSLVNMHVAHSAGEYVEIGGEYHLPVETVEHYKKDARGPFFEEL